MDYLAIVLIVVFVSILFYFFIYKPYIKNKIKNLDINLFNFRILINYIAPAFTNFDAASKKTKNNKEKAIFKKIKKVFTGKQEKTPAEIQFKNIDNKKTEEKPRKKEKQEAKKEELKKEKLKKEEAKKEIEPKDNSKKIFIYGLQGSGKSTLLASLLKYIDLSENKILIAEPNDEYLKTLIKSFYNNNFPPKNSNGEFKKIKLIYEDKNGNNKKSYIFCDASGTEIEKMSPGSPGHSSLLPEIKNCFEKSDALIITASLENKAADDIEKLRDFISFLIKIKYSKPILFVFTKIDMIKNSKIDLETVKKQYNGSVKLLNKHIDSIKYGDFSVGKTDTSIKINNNFLKKNESITVIKEDKSGKYAKEIIKFLESL